MEVQLEERPFGLPVVLGPQAAPDVGLGVGAEPGEPVFDQVADLVPIRPGDAVKELEVAVPVRRGGWVRPDDCGEDRHDCIPPWDTDSWDQSQRREALAVALTTAPAWRAARRPVPR